MKTEESKIVSSKVATIRQSNINNLNIRKIVKLPSILEVFSYMYYFPSALMGPSFEFKDYIDYIYLTGDYKDLERKNSMKAGFIELVKAIANIGLNLSLSGIFNMYYCADPDFGKKNALYKVKYF
jgi:hypothetical protein